MNNASEKIKKLAEDNGGELPSYAWPGGYPMFYVDKECAVLCPKCANKADEYSVPVVDYDVNWEDVDLYCDDCSSRIPSAYGDDKDE